MNLWLDISNSTPFISKFSRLNTHDRITHVTGKWTKIVGNPIGIR